MRPGDKCKNCDIGFMERVIVDATTGGSIFNLLTLGLAGDDERQYFRCTHCRKEYDLNGMDDW